MMTFVRRRQSGFTDCRRNWRGGAWERAGKNTDMRTVGGCRHKPQRRRVGRGRTGYSSWRNSKESFLLWAVCKKVENPSGLP